MTAGLSCGGATEPLPACTAPVALTVSGGTTPTISWTPACGVERLSVSEPLPPSTGFGVALRWVVVADGRLIGPPVRYGQTPRGATVEVAAEPLVAGGLYAASVRDGTQTLGVMTFTP